MVYLHLAWTGPVTRTHPTIARIIEKRSGYTHNDLRDVLHVHAETMSLIVPTMVQLEKEGNFEISVTPFYHPILPLLIDTDVARECMRESPLPFPAFQQPNDAAWHVWAAREEWRKHSGHLPAGMWPAEGSISQAALTMMAASGVQWTATDETVLKNTLGANYTPLSAYRPYTATTSAGNIGVLFRDHALSDAIGFEYASWAPEDAVRNMLARLHQRRERILQTWPEEEHAQAVIPIMLDGENCWEFYHNNGELFLRKLMEALSRDENFQSVTCSEVFTQHKRHQTLPTVVAGSWIGGTFDVWIGSAVKNTAWDLLRQTRCAVERAGNPDAEVALIRSLEASDFFWWYDERHLAPHKHVFDEMFRAGLRDIFARIGEIEPVDLSKTMKELAMSEEPAKQEYPISFAHSTMHDADAMTRSLTVETDGNWQRISIHMSRTPSEFEKVECRFSDRHGVHRQIAIMQNEQLFQSAIHDEGMDRPSPTLVRVYVHTSTVWIVGLEEQRAGGRVARTAVTIRC